MARACSQGISQFLPAHPHVQFAIGMSHTCLCLLTYSQDLNPDLKLFCSIRRLLKTDPTSRYSASEVKILWRYRN